MGTYKNEVQQRWGNTAAYAEYAEKAKENQNEAVAGMNDRMAAFALCMKAGHEPESEAAQALVKALQDYITTHFYTCTDEILAGLGQMYACDERFRENIDKHGNGTAGFIRAAIGHYCKS